MNQKKFGILLSYLNTVLNIGITVCIMPYLINSLGEIEYGVYKTIQSFAGQLGIMTFGICSLVTRGIIKYDIESNKEKKENYLAMILMIVVGLIFITMVVAFILQNGINKLFDRTFSVEQIVLAKKLFWLLIFNICISIFGDMITGMLFAHERYIFRNSSLIIKHILRIVLLIILINIGIGAISIAITDLALNIIVTGASSIYCFVKLEERIKLHYIDKRELVNAFIFSFAILLQAIVNQVNQNVDSIILGSMINPQTVTLYSVGLQIYVCFGTLTNVIESVFSAQVMKTTLKNESPETLTNVIIRPARFQFIVGCWIISGFIVFGKEFIGIWMGENFSNAYQVALVLMIPSLIPLAQHITVSVLDAKMKRLGLSIIYLIMAVINVVISVMLVNKIGYIGAAFGTALSYIIGNGIFMNIYLKRNTEIQLLRMYREIISGTLIVSAISIVSILFFRRIPTNSIFILLVKISVFSITYLFFIYFCALKKYEKQELRQLIQKIFHMQGGKHCE